MRWLALGMVSLGLLVPALASAAQTVPFSTAKRQLKLYTVMTCDGPCEWRVFACHRVSPRRVDCGSEILLAREGVIESKGKSEYVVEREICRWVSVATPSRSSGGSLRIDAKHFRCREAKPDEGLAGPGQTAR